MQHGQNVHHAPINLIKKTGNEVVEIPDGHLCCVSENHTATPFSVFVQQLLVPHNPSLTRERDASFVYHLGHGSFQKLVFIIFSIEPNDAYFI